MAIGGIHAGYNVQNGSFVWGVEADVEGSSFDETADLSFNPNSFGISSDWQASIRGRVGYAWDSTLFYVTGGAALAEISANLVYSSIISETLDSTELGYTVGAGLEHAFSERWSGRLEYRFSNVGDFSETSEAAFPGSIYEQDVEFHAVRIGASYRF